VARARGSPLPPPAHARAPPLRGAEALEAVLAEVKAGVKVLDLCAKGDKYVEECARQARRRDAACRAR
jgi:hypothetical protein